jgi:hypothetical protein
VDISSINKVFLGPTIISPAQNILTQYHLIDKITKYFSTGNSQSNTILKALVFLQPTGPYIYNNIIGKKLRNTSTP